MNPPAPSGPERRKLPDAPTRKVLFLWIALMPAVLWVLQKFFHERFYQYDGQRWGLSPLGSACVFGAAALLAAGLCSAFYKVKYGKFHFIAVARVVRGILSLFLIAVVFVWPIAMMIVAINPVHAAYLAVLVALGIAGLTILIRLAMPPEAGFWRDWIHDTLLRW